MWSTFVGRDWLTGKGVCAFIKATMMSVVNTVHCRLQITACGVSFCCCFAENLFDVNNFVAFYLAWYTLLNISIA